MSNIKVNCDSQIKRGDVISYDSDQNLYIKANSFSKPIGVALDDAITEESLDEVPVVSYFTRMKMQGQVYATCSRDIPFEGGYMSIENGSVFVDNTNLHSCGVVWPNTRNSVQRVAGELVTITLR